MFRGDRGPSRFIALIVLSIAFLWAHAALAQSGLLNAPRIGNWTQAGVQGGVPSGSWTQCGSTINPVGSPGSPASPAAIATAVGNCAGLNQYVKFAAGDFYLDDSIGNGLCFHGIGGVELRGTDPGTRFHMTNGCNAYFLFADVGFSSGDNCAWMTCPNIVNVSGTLSKGSTTITLATVPNLKVGSIINLARSEDTSDIGSYFIQASTSGGNPFTSPGNAGPYSSQGENEVYPGSGETQTVEVTGCNGSTTIGAACSGTNTAVTIYPSIDAPQWAAGTTIAWWASNQGCANVGINNITIDATNDGFGVGSGSGVTIFNCRDVWMINGATTDTSRSGFLFETSRGLTFQSNYVFHSRYGAPSGSTSYGLEISGSSDVLNENNIYQALASGCVLNGGSQNIVNDYNFIIFSFYGPGGTTNTQVGACQLHGIGNDYVYNEGNIIAGAYVADGIHGSHNMGTDLRNYIGGVNPACYVSGTWPSITTGPCTQGPIGTDFKAFSRYFNEFANIRGNPASNGYQNTGTAPIYTNGEPETSGVTTAADPVTTSSLAKYGNCDYVTNGCRFCGNSSNTGWVATCGSASEIPTTDAFYPLPVPTVGDTGIGQAAFPASFLYGATRPSFVPNSKPWPFIGPEVTGGNLNYYTGGTCARAYVPTANLGSCSGGSSASILGGRVYTNPAMDCYFQMGRNPQGVDTTDPTYEASACYNNPAPPVTQPKPAQTMFVGNRLKDGTQLKGSGQ